MNEFNEKWQVGQRLAGQHQPDLMRKYESAFRAQATKSRAAYMGQGLTSAVDPTGDVSPDIPGGIIAGDIFKQSVKARTLPARKKMVNEVAVSTLGKPLAKKSTDVFATLIELIAEKQAENALLAAEDAVHSVILEGITEGLSVSQTANRIGERMMQWAPWQAQRQAQTDLVALANGASLESAKVLGEDGPAFKTWLTAGDENVRDSHVDADGQTVKIDEPFSVGGFPLDHPGDFLGPDSEVINCRCTLIYGFAANEGTNQQDVLAQAASGNPNHDEHGRFDFGAAEARDRARQAKAMRDTNERDEPTVHDPQPQKELVRTDGEGQYNQTAFKEGDRVRSPLGAGKVVGTAYSGSQVSVKHDLGGEVSHHDPFELRHESSPSTALPPREKANMLADSGSMFQMMHDTAAHLYEEAGGDGYGELWFNPESGELVWNIGDWFENEEDGINMLAAIPGVERVDPCDECSFPGEPWVQVYPVDGERLSQPAEDEAILPPVDRLATMTAATFTAEQRKKLAEDGAAMSDGSFPVRNKEDLHNALQSIGRAKNPAEARAHIKARAKALGLTDELPKDWLTASVEVELLPLEQEEGSIEVHAPVAAIVQEYEQKHLGRKVTEAQRDQPVLPTEYDPLRASAHDEASARRQFLNSLAAAGATRLLEQEEEVEENTFVIVASAAPVHPPRDWFATEEPNHPMPLTITADGRVMGHVAVWGSCHTGFPGRCTQPPNSPSGYAYFHTGALETDDGSSIPVGRLTFDGPHASMTASRAQAAAHYDNTCKVGAYVRARDGIHGIWVAGALKSELGAADLQNLRASAPSGDWRRPAPGAPLELVGILGVNVAGFPVPRGLAASALLEDVEDEQSEILALVAAGFEDTIHMTDEYYARQLEVLQMMAAGTLEQEIMTPLEKRMALTAATKITIQVDGAEDNDLGDPALDEEVALQASFLRDHGYYSDSPLSASTLDPDAFSQAVTIASGLVDQPDSPVSIATQARLLRKGLFHS